MQYGTFHRVPYLFLAYFLFFFQENRYFFISFFKWFFVDLSDFDS